MEKLALSLIHASKKLRPYFQAHPIRMYTDQPLRQVLANPETSGRLLKWVVELGQFEIAYHPRTTIKGQALVDFIVECMGEEELADENAPRDVWKLYVDGSATDNGLGAGIILVKPTGHKFHSALRFKFEATNNELEYEALLAGMRMATELKAKAIRCYSDSQLVINQILVDYQAQGTRMAVYLEKVKTAFEDFKFHSVEQIPREDNALADALARQATSKEAEELSIVPIEVLYEPSIVQSQEIKLIEEKTTWITPIIAYLSEGTLPEDRNEARRLTYQLARYTMLDNKLYR